MHAILLLGGILVALRMAPGAEQVRQKPPLQVAPSVDFDRYVGKWYEIARLPNRFQRACASDVTAAYTLRPDGKLNVVNTCRKSDGAWKSAKGTARPAGGGQPGAKLKVTFFWPFSGDYWIVDLDPQYRWALVGEPSRRYLWILSRTPELDKRTYNELVNRAAGQGFDTGRLIQTVHTR